MTLFEKYKEDINAMKNEFEVDSTMGGNIKQHKGWLLKDKKQSYLNTIDCMIEHVIRTPDKSWWAYSEIIEKKAYDKKQFEELEYLKEQRKLIENYE